MTKIADKVNIRKNINYVNNKDIDKSEKTELQTNSEAKKKKIKKALIIASSVALTVGIAALAISKKQNMKKAEQSFEQLVKTTTGNNNILSETIQKEDEAINNFIKNHSEGWNSIKQTILDMVNIKNADEVLNGGTVYHGTSLDSAKNILEKGPTPFSVKRVGSGSGMGYGFYTTPTLDAAKFYSEGQMVLPYEIKGKIAVLKDSVKSSDDIKKKVAEKVVYVLESSQQMPKDDSSFFHFIKPSEDAMKFMYANISCIVTKAMQELGIDAIYTNGATSRGGILSFLNQAPEFLDNAGQVAIYNCKNIHLNLEKLKELNPITNSNYKNFL